MITKHVLKPHQASTFIRSGKGNQWYVRLRSLEGLHAPELVIESRWFFHWKFWQPVQCYGDQGRLWLGWYCILRCP